MNRGGLEIKGGLAASEVLLASVLDTVPIRIFWKDRSLRFMGCNAAFARDAGLANVQDVVGMDDSQMPWREQAEHYRADDQCVLDGSARNMPYKEQQTSADGRLLWLRTSKVPLLDANGAVTGILGTYEDITEQVHSRATTRLRGELLELIVQARSGLGELLHEMILAIEAVFPDFIGSVLLLDDDGLHLSHGAAPNLPQAFVEAIDGVAIGPSVGSCGTAAYFGKEVIVSDISDDPLWQDYKGLALPHDLAACFSEPILDADAKVLGTFAMYWRQPRTPTTSDLELIRMAAKLAAIAIERSAGKHALQATEQMMHALLDHSSAVIYAKAPDGKYLLINKEFEQLFNISKAQVVGQTDDAIFPKEAAEAFRQNDLKALEAQQSIQVEESAETAAGERVYLSVKFALRDSSGQAYATAGVSTDITDRKMFERTLQQQQVVLEQTVQERTSELTERIEQMRRFTLLTADRELRIQELRRENEALKQQLAERASNLSARH